MTEAVRIRDGIRFELDSGRTVAADASNPDADVNLLSHAHGDHLYANPPERVVSSALTLDLAAIRRPDQPRPAIDDPPEVTMYEAGHVPGSRAFLVEDERRILYTGDCSVRDRFSLVGFEPPEADVLIIESTYGKPAYRFPSQSAVEAEIEDWLRETGDRPVLLLGYALGRAQELQLLAERADRDRIFVTEAIEALNEPIAARTGVEFDVAPYTSDVDLRAGDALVLPSQTNNLRFVEQLREETGALKAGFSGWAIDSSYRYARDLDAAFPLSDHPDFDELLEIVRAVDPEVVYTVHGFVDELAAAIQSRLGVSTQALKAQQTSLGEF